MCVLYSTYREFKESEDESGGEAAEEGVGEIATEEGEKKYGGDEVGDNVGRVGQGEVHLVEHVRYEVVPHCTYCHYLKCLKPCTRN